VRGRVVAGLGLALVVLALAVWFVSAKAERPQGGGASGRDGAGRRSDDGGGVQARTNDPAHVRVQGKVVDDDGEPLEGGRVVLSCLVDDEVVPIADGTAPLDESGAFEAPGCAGTICGELHHPTAIASAPWVLEPGRENVLSATALPRIWGVVEDAHGEPIADAKVHIAPPPDAADDPAVLPVVAASTSSDADGHWSVALVQRPPCDPCREAIGACADDALVVHERIEVHARAPGHAAASVELDLAGGIGRGPERPLTMRLGIPADPLTGTLRDPEGRAYARAQVLARSQERPREQHVVKLADGDAFELGDLGPGEYDLRAIQDGVELVPWTPARAGTHVELTGDLAANGPDVVIEVTSAGRALAGVRVDGGPFHDVRTDMQGQVRADRLLPGALSVRLRRGGRRSTTHVIEVPARAPTGPGADRPHRVAIELEPDPDQP